MFLYKEAFSWLPIFLVPIVHEQSRGAHRRSLSNTGTRKMVYQEIASLKGVIIHNTAYLYGYCCILRRYNRGIKPYYTLIQYLYNSALKYNNIFVNMPEQVHNAPYKGAFSWYTIFLVPIVHDVWTPKNTERDKLTAPRARSLYR